VRNENHSVRTLCIETPLRQMMYIQASQVLDDDEG